MNKLIKILLIAIFCLILALFFLRLILPREIDDVSPGISCKQKYLQKADILWIIPEFSNSSISENKSWCEEILSLNKTLGLHGLTHEYKEFLINRNSEYLEKGIKEFEKCFNQTPTMFKPPQLTISKENKKQIKEKHLKLKSNFNQLIHKVYHCNDTGRFSNKLINLF